MLAPSRQIVGLLLAFRSTTAVRGFDGLLACHVLSAEAAAAWATSGCDPAGDRVGVVTTDATGALVRRLARPHVSGGMVIERSVILAEGADSAAILTWIFDHDGVPDSVAATTPSSGLHGSRTTVSSSGGPARRYVLPARAFTSV